jgi:hypothetical protein
MENVSGSKQQTFNHQYADATSESHSSRRLLTWGGTRYEPVQNRPRLPTMDGYYLGLSGRVSDDFNSNHDLKVL